MSRIDKSNIEKELQATCPHWQAPKCGSTDDTYGVYIPLNHHIQRYCESTDYTLCTQYTENNKGGSRGSNRRRRLRIQSNHPITIVRLNHSGNVISRERGKASIIDLSTDGMRLQSDKPMLKDSFVQFLVNDSLVDRAQRGIALSRWCSHLPGQNGYQIGFAFHGKETERLMGNCFNSEMRRKKSRS